MIEVRICQWPKTPTCHNGDERFVCTAAEKQIRNLAEAGEECEVEVYTKADAPDGAATRVTQYLNGVIFEVQSDQTLGNEPPVKLPPLVPR